MLSIVSARVLHRGGGDRAFNVHWCLVAGDTCTRKELREPEPQLSSAWSTGDLLKDKAGREEEKIS